MSDGRPGKWTTLNIRNMGTPLYVVDGVQMEEGQFNNIDFNDIESISVLKTVRLLFMVYVRQMVL